jgi:hypothetical protein
MVERLSGSYTRSQEGIQRAKKREKCGEVEVGYNLGRKR